MSRRMGGTAWVGPAFGKAIIGGPGALIVNGAFRAVTERMRRRFGTRRKSFPGPECPLAGSGECCHNPLYFIRVLDLKARIAGRGVMSDRYDDDIFVPSGRLRPDILDESTSLALRESLGYARATNWDSVRTPHLFMGLLASPDPSVSAWAERLGADLPRL